MRRAPRGSRKGSFTPTAPRNHWWGAGVRSAGSGRERPYLLRADRSNSDERRTPGDVAGRLASRSNVSRRPGALRAWRAAYSTSGLWSRRRLHLLGRSSGGRSPTQLHLDLEPRTCPGWNSSSRSPSLREPRPLKPSRAQADSGRPRAFRSGIQDDRPSFLLRPPLPRGRG